MRKCEGLCFSLDGALLVASFCEMPKGMDSDDQGEPRGAAAHAHTACHVAAS